MRTSKLVQVVSAHAAGEVGDVIVGGVAPPPGATLWDKRNWIAQDGALRNFVLNEPRGGVFRHVNLLVPPVDPRADAAWIIMEPEDTPPMSGSNAICVATVLLETGMLPMQEPVTDIVLEAPGGLVKVQAQGGDGKVLQVTLTNLPAFADRLGAKINVAGLGELEVDTAFGGDSFVLVDATQLDLELCRSNARLFAEMGSGITDAANAQLGFEHPEIREWQHISFCQFTWPTEMKDGILRGANTVSIKPAKLDRSPCGTGTCARMAVLRARGELALGDRFRSVSVIGSEFEGRFLEETKVGEKPGIVPQISGTAWITGTHQIMLDPDDPWPEGYRLSDTWPALG